MELSLKDIFNSRFSRNNLKILYLLNKMSDDELVHYGIASRHPVKTGAAGMIFPGLRNDEVVKLSCDEKDISKSYHVNNLSSTPKVNGIFKLPFTDEQVDDGKPVYGLRVQKMHDIPEDIQNFLNYILQYYIDKINDEKKAQKRKINLKASRQLLRDLNKYYKMHKDKLSLRQKKYLNQIKKMLRELHKNNMHFHDQQVSQMKVDDKGKLKIVDFGSIDINECRDFINEFLVLAD